VAFALVGFEHRLLEGVLVGLRPALPFAFDVVAAHGREHACCLRAAHHRNARVGPCEHEARPIRAPAHRIVAGTVAAADDERDLRHVGVGDRHHHLRAVPRDAAGFRVATDHETGDVLEEQQRRAALAGEFDEVGRLLRGF
jgi:hypothetical protein